MKKGKRASREQRIDGPALLYDEKAIREALREARKQHTQKVKIYARGLD